MANGRDALVFAYRAGVLDEVEFLLLNELNAPQNLHIPYWQYDAFSLDLLTDDECWTEFQLMRNDIYNLVNAQQLPDQLVTYNRLKLDSVEGLCVLFKRLAYPCRYSDVVSRFTRPVPDLCVIINHLLTNPKNMERYTKAIHGKGAPRKNCWGFVDGTVQPVSRPGNNQQVLYNGHKRMYAIQFQSIATPDGLVAFLQGPYKGKRHDSGILRESRFVCLLEEFSISPNGEVMCIYGDSAYLFRPQLQAPFKGANITADEQLRNT